VLDILDYKNKNVFNENKTETRMTENF